MLSSDDHELQRVLAEVQRRGGIGPVPLETAIAHARRYVAVLPDGQHRLVDLGSGGGLPGVVIAWDRPDLEMVLVERRAKRADLLRYAVRALGRETSVVVDDRDADQVASTGAGTFDVVTARMFASPDVLLPLAARLLRPGGVVIVSDLPAGTPGPTGSDLERWGLVDLGSTHGIRQYRRL